MEEKIVITKKYLIIGEYNSYVREYSDLHELYQMLKHHFILSNYNNINVVKRVNKKCIKVSIYHNSDSFSNAVVICDKNLIYIVNAVLNELNYEKSKPNGGKNKQKTLKMK